MRQALPGIARRSIARVPARQATLPARKILESRLEGIASYEERAFRSKLGATIGAFPPERFDSFVHNIFEQTTLATGTHGISLSQMPVLIDAIRTRCPLASAVLDVETAVRHFERADKDGDGQLSCEEVRGYLHDHVLHMMYTRHLDAELSVRRAGDQLSRTPLLEARVQQLVPNIDRDGMHANRLVLFGGVKPEHHHNPVLMRTNDYLQLSGHAEVAAATAEVLLHDKVTERRARVFTLDSPDRHRALELRIAGLLGAQDACLAMSGAHAVKGLLETLCTSATPIYADRLSWTTSSLRHTLKASIIPFSHNSMSGLRNLAEEEPGVIVVDGVYGNGACAHLKEAASIAETTGSVLVVDETHSFGCAAGGLGLCEELGISHLVHFRAFGFSKAFASRGGIIVGPSRALEAFRFIDRQMIFSTAPLEHEIVGYDATLDVLLRDDWRREALHNNHARLKAGLLDLGYVDDIMRSDRQILAIITGDAERTSKFRNFLAERGVFGSVFCPPATREGRAYVRFTVNSGVTGDQIEHFLNIMREARHILLDTHTG
ncbi:hypothetical protein AB1Y20_010547 [Prymnesium parvum]|uniref:EF-hand domain-containing protein n=1 Tax=Prymnesium parvum TaxID=97485 RepID=A0AB34IRT4_PRYPA